MKTTLQVSKPTLDRLASHKRFERESYDEVLNFILDEYEQETLSTEDVVEIQQGLEDIKRGKVKRIEEVAKDLGIRL
jgi:predicted transcriptional regulator